jgi:hypothetical protein
MRSKTIQAGADDGLSEWQLCNDSSHVLHQVTGVTPQISAVKDYLVTLPTKRYHRLSAPAHRVVAGGTRATDLMLRTVSRFHHRKHPRADDAGGFSQAAKYRVLTSVVRGGE